MAKKSKRVQTDGGTDLSGMSGLGDALGSLELGHLPSASTKPETAPAESQAKPQKSRGRVDMRLEKSGRGGKLVTVIYNFSAIDGKEIQDLAKELRKATGTGGTCKQGKIELQGDSRDQAESLLVAKGWKPVRTGG